MSKKILLLSTFFVLNHLIFSIYKYYQNMELVEIPPKSAKIRYSGGGTAHFIENYKIIYQEKKHDREYKVYGISNWLWRHKDLSKNQLIQKEPIYFYRLKSDAHKTNDIPYFLPSANKPITNKVFLVLDIWGYFMTNWFWYLFIFIVSNFLIGDIEGRIIDIPPKKKEKKAKWYITILIYSFFILAFMLFFY